MDSKTFSAALAKRTGRGKKDVETLMQAIKEAIRQYCGELDTVAIPGFGNFEAVKHDEQIVNDRVSGKMMLLPPEVELTFHPATKLRTSLEKLQ